MESLEMQAGKGLRKHDLCHVEVIPFVAIADNGYDKEKSEWKKDRNSKPPSGV